MKQLTVILLFAAVPAFSQLIQPNDLEYLGAFRLPEGSGGSDWNYSGCGSAYYPQGDPSGPNDGYPGSIFAIGNNTQAFVSEISIPVPIISSTRNPANLNTAETLQPFSDVRGGLFGELEQPRADLEYLPPQAGQTSGKLHFCWGQHLLSERAPTHGWCNTTLSDPQTAGAWFIGDYTNYIVNDYLFEIPEVWSSEHVPGQRLATGRFRDGGWGGQGPALLAYNPLADGNPPASNTALKSVTPLLLYGEHIPGIPEISNLESMKMKYYKDADDWSGGAWLTAGGNSTLIFVGTKAMGKSWYGYSDGTEYPTDGEGPFPPIPAFPHDQRGWWADSIQAQILFYDPDDLADVAHGRKKPYESQPYAFMNLNPYLFDPGYDYTDETKKMVSLGDCCYDRARNILYIFEHRADGDKSLVHVFWIRESGTGVREPESGKVGSWFGIWGSGNGGREPGIGNRVSGFDLEQNYPNPFNPQTAIHFRVGEPCRVELKVFDIRGSEVSTLADGKYEAGEYVVRFDASSLPSGIFLYRIGAGYFTAAGKMTVMK